MIRLLRERLAELLGSADFARVYALTALGVAFSGFAIENLASRWTLYSMVGGLVVVGAAMLFVRRGELTLIGFAPTMLLAFVGWALISVAWAFDRWESLTSWVALASFTFIAIAIAKVRDTAQIVRALGDVLRALLGASLALEVLVGILLDTSFDLLGIAGDVAFGGPIQGLFGTRNMLAFVSIIAFVTFFVEWRIRALRSGQAVASLVLAAATAVLSASPTAVILAILVGVALTVLMLVRRVRGPNRLEVQRWLGIAVVIVGVAAYLLRGWIFDAINAATAFANRSALWSELLGWIQRRIVQGWGWHGTWEGEPFPFRVINFLLDTPHDSALNAYLDVLVQLGGVGLLLFGGMCAVAFARAWVMASSRRSSVHLWTPLVLVVILATSAAESFTLQGPGWLLLALCVVVAGQARSWRTLVLDRRDAPEPLPHDGG